MKRSFKIRWRMFDCYVMLSLVENNKFSQERVPYFVCFLRCRSKLSPGQNHQILPTLHSASLFTCTLTHHSPSLKCKFRIWKLRFPNLASGGVVSFVFFGATRFGSKGLYPNLVVRVCGIITVLRPFIPSPQALTHISTLKPPSRMATKNGGGGGLPVSASDTSFAYRLLSPVVYMYLFGCVDETSFAYGLHYPVIYRSLLGCVDWPLISPCFDLPTSRPCKVLHAHLSSLFTTYSATVEWFRQLCMGDVGIEVHDLSW
ncbi:unnamed protein product [Brassica oleracea]